MTSWKYYDFLNFFTTYLCGKLIIDVSYWRMFWEIQKIIIISESKVVSTSPKWIELLFRIETSREMVGHGSWTGNNYSLQLYECEVWKNQSIRANIFEEWILVKKLLFIYLWISTSYSKHKDILVGSIWIIINQFHISPRYQYNKKCSLTYYYPIPESNMQYPDLKSHLRCVGLKVKYVSFTLNCRVSK